MAKPESYYDEDLDQPIADPRNAEGDGDDGGDYKTFLAPKSAFAGKDLDVGAVHRVKIERVLDSEVELRCVQKGDDDEDSGLYD